MPVVFTALFISCDQLSKKVYFKATKKFDFPLHIELISFGFDGFYFEKLILRNDEHNLILCVSTTAHFHPAIWKICNFINISYRKSNIGMDAPTVMVFEWKMQLSEIIMIICYLRWAISKKFLEMDSEYWEKIRLLLHNKKISIKNGSTKYQYFSLENARSWSEDD